MALVGAPVVVRVVSAGRPSSVQSQSLDLSGDKMVAAGRKLEHNLVRKPVDKAVVVEPLADSPWELDLMVGPFAHLARWREISSGAKLVVAD